MIFVNVEKGARPEGTKKETDEKEQRNWAGANGATKKKTKKKKKRKGGRIETRHSIAKPVSGANQFRCIREECTGHGFANGDTHSRRFSTSAIHSNAFL